ncbi:oxidoreductase [Ideonella sp. BN130291]|uniref:oxidoreductase n=1 Tax=Ideonella sp. BN130291 TaxID=3112940 RepID=UPI002E25C957|nr:oxidoreductase [Ideonella sp. BN130291]
MNSPALRVGLLGFGYASQTFHAPLIQATPGLALVAVSSSQPDKVQAALGPGVVVYAQAEALIRQAEIDLVVIPTPNDTHHPLAHAALQAGRHVVVDKPFTLDTAQAEALVQLAQQRGRLLSVFHNRRWDGDFLRVKQLLADATRGRVHVAALHFARYRPEVRQRWREADLPGAGIWMDLAPHLLDQALQLFGWPVALQADIAALRAGARTDDFFHASLRYADGLRVSLHASMLCAAPGPRFVLHGSRGSYVKQGADPQEEALKAGQRPDAAALQEWGHDAQAGELTLADGAGGGLATRPVPNERGNYLGYYQQLREATRGRAPNPVPAWQAVQVMQLLDLGRCSAAQRCELPCPTAFTAGA